jgi:hypothetical protein
MNTLKLSPSWPDATPTEILPEPCQGGKLRLPGMPTTEGHYRWERPFDSIITLYADAKPAPGRVERIRNRFPY